MTHRWKVDLHNHTFRSRDCLTSYEAVIQAVQQKGLDVIAITDHNEVQGGLELREIAPFPVIVGEEIKTAEGEIIGLFLKERIPPGLSPKTTIEGIREQGGVIYVPHPLDGSRGSTIRQATLERIRSQIDVLEVFNARCVFRRANERALAFAKEHGLPGGAGSDAHTAGEIGTAYVEMPPFETAEEFLSSVAQAQVVGRLSNPVVHLASTYARLRRRLAGGR